MQSLHRKSGPFSQWNDGLVVSDRVATVSDGGTHQELFSTSSKIPISDPPEQKYSRKPSPNNAAGVSRDQS